MVSPQADGDANRRLERLYPMLHETHGSIEPTDEVITRNVVAGLCGGMWVQRLRPQAHECLWAFMGKCLRVSRIVC